MGFLFIVRKIKNEETLEFISSSSGSSSGKKGTKVGEGEQSHGDGMERRKIKEANEIKGESFC